VGWKREEKGGGGGRPRQGVSCLKWGFVKAEPMPGTEIDSRVLSGISISKPFLGPLVDTGRKKEKT